MFEKIANSFSLARSSWNVLRTDMQLLVFPIFSGIASLLVLASFVAPFIVLLSQQKQLDDLPQWVWYVTAFAFYFCNYFVIIFFNSALTSCALMRFNGHQPTIGGGLKAAALCLPQILAWALVSASVGMLLKVIENSSEYVGKIVSALLGTAWSVVTFFVVPVLVVEKVGPIDAVKRSVEILKQSWGEALVGNFGIGLFIFLMMLPIIAIIVVGVFVCAAAPALLPLGIGLLVLGGLGFLGLLAVSSAMDNIFVAALYQYAAQGQVPEGFNDNTIRNAFSSK